VQIGSVYRHSAFYVDPMSGELKTKYLVVLALSRDGDVVARLLTSRYDQLRPKTPPCHHGNPYPGYYLGVLGGELNRETWVDLRQLDDLEGSIFRQWIERGVAVAMRDLPTTQLRDVLLCVAGADDTPRHQENAIRDELARIR
jgi:hypothetical protein